MNQDKEVRLTAAGTNIDEVKRKMQRPAYPIMK